MTDTHFKNLIIGPVLRISFYLRFPTLQGTPDSPNELRQYVSVIPLTSDFLKPRDLNPLKKYLTLWRRQCFSHVLDDILVLPSLRGKGISATIDDIT